MIKDQRRWFLYILLLALPFFFVGGPDYDSRRSVKELWNLGHFFFFIVFILVQDSYWCSMHRSLYFRIGAAFLTVTCLAFGTELLQLLITDRFFSWGDVGMDLMGGATALLWRAGRGLPRLQATLTVVVSIALVCVNFVPLGRVLVDEYRSGRDFPLLAGFETSIELRRWASDRVELSRVTLPRVQGNSSARITLTTDKYSGVALKYFPGDWQGRRALAFHVFNPGHPLTLHYRVHDALHRGEMQNFGNRYNGRTLLTEGWNEIIIPMADILAAPEGRPMDVTKIRGFGVFVVQQKERRVLFLDNVRLL
ncbi:VanZ family protein [Desulfocastanea catecholica]